MKLIIKKNDNRYNSENSVFGDIFDNFLKKISITIRAQIRTDMLLLHEEMGQYAALGEEEKKKCDLGGIQNKNQLVVFMTVIL